MIVLFWVSLLFVIMAAIAWRGSRSSRLQNMARNLQARYDRQVDCPLTPQSAQHVRLFNEGLHQFFNVLTFQHPGAFLRVSDAHVFTAVQDKAPRQTYTLITAELTRGTFTPLVLVARTNPQAPHHPALSADLAGRYTLQAPENYQLPPSVQGLLKAGNPCYIELTEHALVYHEYTTAKIDQIQPLCFRVKQLIAGFQPAPQEKANTGAEPTCVKTPAELQVQVLLKLQSTALNKPNAGSSKRMLYGFVLLLLLIGVCLLAGVAMQQVPR